MILFRLVFKEFLKFVAATVALCLFLFILFDFIHKTNSYFARYEPHPGLIARYYIYQIPLQLVQILPIASLLSSVIVMVLYNRSNEIAAMRAAGMSPSRIIAPLACGGLILTGLSFFLNEIVVPVSSGRMHYVNKVLIEGENVFGTDEQAHWVRSGRRIFHFATYRHAEQVLENVKLIDLDDDFRPFQATHALEAHYITSEKKWNMLQAVKLNLKQGGQIAKLEKVSALKLSLPVEPEKLNIDRRNPDELGLTELSERIVSGVRRGADVLALKIAWHIKLAYPVAAFLISLLGLKFGYRSERSAETVRSMLLAFAIGISYWFILSAARALAGAGNLTPLLAGWSANFLIFIFVTWQFIRVHRLE